MNFLIGKILIILIMILTACSPATIPAPVSPVSAARSIIVSPAPVIRPTSLPAEDGPNLMEEKMTAPPSLQPADDSSTAKTAPVFTLTHLPPESGAAETWSLFADGRLITPTGEKQNLTAAQTAQFLTGLEDLTFFSLSPQYRCDSSCNQSGHTYIISARWRGQKNRIKLVNGIPRNPAEIQKIMQLFLKVIQPGRTTPPSRF